MSDTGEAGAPRVVALGGRSGPSLIVKGFRGTGWDITALVITTDSGSSSGVIRERLASRRRGTSGACLSQRRIL